jgi:EAL domain-containing protein (putative c-di-GMP-specific phosphodiesterase class I)
VVFATALGMKTTAEGFETAEQLVLIKKLGWHSGHGYFLSRPLEKSAFMDFVLNGLAISSEQLSV